MRVFSILVSLLFLLAACGFTPLYQQGTDTAHQLRNIRIAPIQGRVGQVFTTSLEDSLGGGAAPSPTPAATLTVSLGEQHIPVAIGQDRRIARYDYILTSTYTLSDNATGRLLTKGSVKRITSYNNVDADFSAFVTKQDAMERAARELAEQYRLRLAAFYAKQGQAQ